VPYGPALVAGLMFDLAARLSGHRFPISAVRVRKYRAVTRFDATCLAASGFAPRYGLRESLIATIQHEFGAPRDAQRNTEKQIGYDPAA
jgi:hypothetical protein